MNRAERRAQAPKPTRAEKRAAAEKHNAEAKQRAERQARWNETPRRDRPAFANTAFLAALYAATMVGD